MRIVVAGLTIAFLSACGANQTEQISNNQAVVKQNEMQVVMEKPESTELSAGANSESASVNDGVEDLKLEESSIDIAADSTSNNAMIKDAGIDTESGNLEEPKAMEAMEGEKKEIAKQKESEVSQDVEPKS